MFVLGLSGDYNGDTTATLLSAFNVRFRVDFRPVEDLLITIRWCTRYSAGDWAVLSRKWRCISKHDVWVSVSSLSLIYQIGVCEYYNNDFPFRRYCLLQLYRITLVYHFRLYKTYFFSRFDDRLRNPITLSRVRMETLIAIIIGQPSWFSYLHLSPLLRWSHKCSDADSGHKREHSQPLKTNEMRISHIKLLHMLQEFVELSLYTAEFTRFSSAQICMKERNKSIHNPSKFHIWFNILDYNIDITDNWNTNGGNFTPFEI
jgi:hypothetical protein